MNKAAKDYNSQGLELVQAGRLEAAVDFFSKAIAEDPDFLEAYKNRGEALIKLNRVAEGEKDIQKASGQQKKTGKANKQQRKAVEKYNLHEVEDLWATVLSDESSEMDDDEMYGLDDLLDDESSSGSVLDIDQSIYPDDEQSDDTAILYDDTFSKIALGEELSHDEVEDQLEGEDLHDETFADDVTESEQLPEESEPVPAEPEFCSVMLEYRGGTRQEVSHARLFEPENNCLLLIDEETNDEAVVLFDQLTCLRVSSLPARFSATRKEPSTQEIIETDDGSIFRELVPANQNLDSVLICFSPDDETRFPVTLIPRSFIKKRIQDKRLIDILLEKRFISKTILQRALQEYEVMKGMTLEKIIAEKARIPLAQIEEAIDQAQQGHMQGMQKEEILLFSGLVTEEEILYAVERLENIKNLKIGQFLIEKGYVREREVYICLAEKHSIPFVDLKGRKFSKQSLTSLPKTMVVEHEILPLAMKDDTLLVAAHFTDMTPLTETIARTAGCKHVKHVMSPPTDIRKILNVLHAKKN